MSLNFNLISSRSFINILIFCDPWSASFVNHRLWLSRDVFSILFFLILKNLEEDFKVSLGWVSKDVVTRILIAASTKRIHFIFVRCPLPGSAVIEENISALFSSFLPLKLSLPSTASVYSFSSFNRPCKRLVLFVMGWISNYGGLWLQIPSPLGNYPLVVVHRSKTCPLCLSVRLYLTSLALTASVCRQASSSFAIYTPRSQDYAGEG